MRLINVGAEGKADNNAKAKKHAEYVLRKDATAKSLTYFEMVSSENPIDDFGFFARRTGKDAGRPLKHLVVSYKAKKELQWVNYLEVTKEIAGFFGKEYQIIAAVHDNIPNRPHAHILVDCFNVSTEKKMSESPREFWRLVEYVNSVLDKNDIYPLLQGCRQQKKDAEVGVCETAELCSDISMPASVYCEEYLYNVPIATYQQDKDFNGFPVSIANSGVFVGNGVKECFDGAARDDFSAYFPNTSEEQSLEDILRITRFLGLEDKNKMMIYGITIVEDGKVINYAGHSLDLQTNERLFYDGGLEKSGNFEMLRKGILGSEKSIELNKREIEQPKSLFKFVARCNVCGRILTDKESLFCRKNNLIPTCYYCQHSKI